MVALALALQLAGPLRVVRVERVTSSPAARDNAAAVAAGDGLVVLWEQAPGLDASGSPRPPVTVWAARVGPRGVDHAGPLVTAEGNQWWPAPLGGTAPMLAVYSADRSRRTGDRDVLLYRPDATWRAAGRGQPITRDAPGIQLPVNDATPAIARGTSGRIVIAYSSGEYRAGSGYTDKDLRAVRLGADGLPGPVVTLTDSTERGHEYAPALLPDGRDGFALVYASDSAAGGRYDLYLRRLGSTLTPSPPVRLTRSSAGAIRPTLVRVGATDWLSWYDLGGNDVLLSPLQGDRLGEATSLRTLLQGTGFERLTAPMAGLAGASLFVDGGRLGIVFVATAERQQQVFVAWLEPVTP
jgi:hypothetical protein